MFGEGYAKHLMGKGRKVKGRPLHLRSQTPASSQHGGMTGHFAGSMPGMHAANPHNGMHAGRSPVPEGAMQHQQIARSTGYGAPGREPAAASPNMGFVVAGKGRRVQRG